MNDTINFNNNIINNLQGKFRAEDWSGRAPKFYKTDIPNLVKCVEITKLYKQDNFICSLTIFSNFKTSKILKNQLMHTHKRIFSVALTPDGVTSSAYQWPLQKENTFNQQQFKFLWNAFTNHGKEFFERFTSLPEPFLEITPEMFKKGKVKLLNKFYVWHQINYINFLKEVHISVNQLDTAAQFSNLALELVKEKLSLENKTLDKTKNEYLSFLQMP